MRLCGLKDYKTLFAFLFVLWAAPALAQPTIVNTPSPFSTSSAAAPSYTYNFQCNATTDFLLVFVHSYGSYDSFDTTHQTATFNGVSATLQTGAGHTAEDITVYTLASPATGAAHDFIVTYSSVAPPFGGYIQAFCLTGTNASTPVGQKTATFNVTDSSPMSDTITSASDSLVFDAGTTNWIATITPDASQTQLYNSFWGSPGNVTVESSDKVAGSTMQWTWTGGGSLRTAHAVIEIKAAGTPPPAGAVRHRRVQ